MPILGRLTTKDNRLIGRKFHPWHMKEGKVHWSEVAGDYVIDPEFYVRIPVRPFWHFMFLLPFILPKFFPRPEQWAQFWVEGEQSPIDMRHSTKRSEESSKRVWGRTAEGQRQATIADGVRDLMATAPNHLMLVLMMSVLCNIILIIVVAIKSINL